MVIKKPYIILAVIILIALFFNLTKIKELKQLPSPLYGGDLYYHLGGIYNLQQGNSYLDNPQMIGEYAWTPPLYNFIVLYFSKIVGLTVEKGVLFSSLLFLIMSVLISYFVAKKIFDDDYFALIPATLIMIVFPIFKYTDFALVILMPLFFYSSFLNFKELSLKNGIFHGIVVGLLGITHLNFFIGAVIYSVLLYTYILYNKRKSLKKEYRKDIGCISAASIIGFSISLITWYVPLFIYKLKLANDIAAFDAYDLSKLSNMFFITWEGIKANFLNIAFSNSKNIFYSIITISIIILIVLLILDKNKTNFKKFLLFHLIATFIAANHHYLSYPLLKTNFFPHYINAALFFPFFIFSASYLYFLLVKKYKKIVCAILVFFFLALIMSSLNNRWQTDRWIAVGKTELSPLMKEVSNWITKNTQINDVFLSTNEISFALSALTGRKGVNFRRAHSGMYVDVDQRYLDSALILYGNDTNLKKQLIKKYDIKYLYWDYYWVQSEFSFDKDGNVIGWFDPLMIKYSEERESILKANNISYFKTKTFLDPANRGKRTVQFDVLIISPENYRSARTPWKADLDEFIRPVANFMNLSVVYEVFL